MRNCIIFVAIIGSIYGSGIKQNTIAIIETDTIKDIEKYITTNNPLILFDMDKTLVQYNMTSPSCMQLENITLPDFKGKWFCFEPVEQDALAAIRALTHRYKIAMLTGCSSDVNYYKFYQLDQLKLDVTESFKNIPFYTINNEAPAATFDKGVICTKGHNKGEILELFLTQNSISPSQIIFVDNQKKNILDVAKAIKYRNIPYTGIVYTRAQ